MQLQYAHRFVRHVTLCRSYLQIMFTLFDACVRLCAERVFCSYVFVFLFVRRSMNEQRALRFRIVVGLHLAMTQFVDYESRRSEWINGHTILK